ncbi:MAG: carbohydrate-binding domain-containing protein [Propioniciclava sp.]
MTRTPSLIGSVVALAAILTGCSAGGASTGPAAADTPVPVAVSGTPGITAAAALAENAAPDPGDIRDAASSAVRVTLTGDSAIADSEAVRIDGDTVTITAPGTYLLGGELAGQVVVDSPSAGEVVVVLSDASITSGAGAALVFADVDAAAVVLADGTQNTLTSAALFADSTAADAPNAALFSRADLTIGGSGSLAVHAPSLDGIAATDGLVITEGTVRVAAADDGIRGKDHLVIDGGTITVTSGGDALKSDNDTAPDAGYIAIAAGTLALAAGGDGLTAHTDIVITGGTLAVTTGGGRGTPMAQDASAKGLKAGANLVIEGGTTTIDAAEDAIHSGSVVSLNEGAITAAAGDDGVHADDTVTVAGGRLVIPASNEGIEGAAVTIAGGNSTVTAADDAINVADQVAPDQGTRPAGLLSITGGTLVLDAGGDGLDSNGSVEMTGGTVTVWGPAGDGNGSLDVDGGFALSGGILLAAGSAGMAAAPDAEAAQGWVQANVSGEAGAVIQITDGTAVLAEYTAEKSFANVVFSSEAIAAGTSYAVQVDGVVTTVSANQATAGGGPGPGRGPRR